MLYFCEKKAMDSQLSIISIIYAKITSSLKIEKNICSNGNLTKLIVIKIIQYAQKNIKNSSKLDEFFLSRYSIMKKV